MVLPRGMRIKGYRYFDYIHKSGVRYNSSSMLLKVATFKANSIKGKPLPSRIIPSCRCAVSISNKVSKRAVVRNHLRRILHKHLKSRLLHRVNFKDNLLLLSLRPCSLERSHQTLLKEVDILLSKAGLPND